MIELMQWKCIKIVHVCSHLRSLARPSPISQNGFVRRAYETTTHYSYSVYGFSFFFRFRILSLVSFILLLLSYIHLCTTSQTLITCTHNSIWILLWHAHSTLPIHNYSLITLWFLYETNETESEWDTGRWFFIDSNCIDLCDFSFISHRIPKKKNGWFIYRFQMCVIHCAIAISSYFCIRFLSLRFFCTKSMSHAATIIYWTLSSWWVICK